MVRALLAIPIFETVVDSKLIRMIMRISFFFIISRRSFVARFLLRNHCDILPIRFVVIVRFEDYSSIKLSNIDERS